MAKHRKEDRIKKVQRLDELPYGIHQLSAEHFENNILEKIFSCSEKNKKETSTICSQECKKTCRKKNFYYYNNEQFGETNGFVVFHTEEDKNGHIFGWVDFVMVKTENRSEGLGAHLTELAIDYLQTVIGSVSISTTLLIPVGADGEVGVPAYGSENQLKQWGFSEIETNKYKYITIGDCNYKKSVYVLV